MSELSNPRVEQKRQQIVKAAADLFYRQGFNATSFTDLALAADVPRGNFYYYFKTKDDILVRVIELQAEEIRRLLLVWNEIETPLARLHALLDTLLSHQQDVVRFGCPVGTLNAELSKTNPQLQSKAAELFEVFISWLEKQFIAIGCTDSARALSVSFMAHIQGATVVANAFGDKQILVQEGQAIKDWLERLSCVESRSQ